ncbi:hypothetical protein V6259_08390 [Marinomonas sp. TI.3.20]|uniref:hypothetical protein n=1 Tax=Marinomonas sp. TI.3.20 TaxID=3121296 RepID=UPI00311E696B
MYTNETLSNQDHLLRAKLYLKGIAEVTSTWESHEIFLRGTNEVMFKRVNQLKDLGFFNALIPCELGGIGLSWKEVVEAGRIASSFCPSSGWLLSLLSGHAGMLMRLPLQIIEDIIYSGSNNVLVATVTNTRDGKLYRKNHEGYVLNGTWHYCSGVDYADYVIVTSKLEFHDDFLGENKYLVLIKKNQFEVLDDWNVSGLSGTGSKSIVFNNLEVSYDKVFFRPDYFNNNEFSGYDVFESKEVLPVTTSLILGPILGCFEGGLKSAICEIESLVKKSNNSTKFHYLHTLLNAKEQLNLMRILYVDLISSVEKSIINGSIFSLEDKFNMLSKKSFFSKLALDSMSPIIQTIGSNGNSMLNNFRVFWNDMQAMSTHMDVKWERALSDFEHLSKNKDIQSLVIPEGY